MMSKRNKDLRVTFESSDKGGNGVENMDSVQQAPLPLTPHPLISPRLEAPDGRLVFAKRGCVSQATDANNSHHNATKPVTKPGQVSEDATGAGLAWLRIWVFSRAACATVVLLPVPVWVQEIISACAAGLLAMSAFALFALPASWPPIGARFRAPWIAVSLFMLLVGARSKAQPPALAAVLSEIGIVVQIVQRSVYGGERGVDWKRSTVGRSDFSLPSWFSLPDPSRHELWETILTLADSATVALPLVVPGTVWSRSWASARIRE